MLNLGKRTRKKKKKKKQPVKNAQGLCTICVKNLTLSLAQTKHYNASVMGEKATNAVLWIR